MKLQTKITLSTSLFLIMVVAVITFFSVKNIQDQGERRLRNYRAEAIDDAKENLKDLVDVAYETIDRNYAHLSDIGYLSKYYERRLSDIVITGERIIKRYQRQVAAGQLLLSEAKRKAMNEIKALRFDGGTGYIWINDIGQPYPRMIMHPTVPALDGVILDSPKYNNALGERKNLFAAFVDVTEDDGEGFVDYLWPKPTPNGLSKKMPKLSYVKRYEQWGWIIGTGIYIDDAQEEIEQQIKNTIKSMRYADGTGYFWINDNTLPYPTMVMHPTVPALDGNVLDDPKYNNALGIDKNLFQAFVEVTQKEQEGFVDYLWPKPTKDGLTARTPKISYVKLHKPFGWIIGSGAYIDNIDKTVENKKIQINNQIFDLVKNNIMVALLFTALAVVLSYLFAGTLSKPILRLTGVAEQISKGKGLDQPINETKRSDEIGELARAVDRLKTSVKIMLDRISQG